MKSSVKMNTFCKVNSLSFSLLDTQYRTETSDNAKKQLRLTGNAVVLTFISSCFFVESLLVFPILLYHTEPHHDDDAARRVESNMKWRIN